MASDVASINRVASEIDIELYGPRVDLVVEAAASPDDGLSLPESDVWSEIDRYLGVVDGLPIGRVNKRLVALTAHSMNRGGCRLP